MYPTITTNCRNLPSAGVQKGQADRPKCLSLREKTIRVATNVYSRKMLEKPKWWRSAHFENKGSRSCLRRGKVLAPMPPSQRTAAFNRVCKTWLQILYFPFLCLLFFWGRQGCCPCSYISSGAMRNSDLRSSLSLKVCVLHWFYVFWKIDFNCEQKSFKALDLETIFWFWKGGESR